MPGLLDWLDRAAARRAEQGLTRQLVTHRPDDVVDLAGNDYLGLRRHPRVVAAAVAAAEQHGGGAGASRLVTGTLAIHDELERALGDLTGAGSALVLSTGYAANLSVLTTLTDRSTLVVSDAHNHASIVDGCRLARPGRVEVARHGDLDHVRALLRERSEERAVVVVESLYSVLGDAADIPALIELTARHGAVLVVDEAHAIGVVGTHGEGLVAAAGGFAHDHVVVTGTLSKALASQGGFVAAHPAVREHLVNTARPFIYDTGLAPAAAGAALGALDILCAEPTRPGALHAAADRLADALGIDAPRGAVMSVPMPGPDEALAAVAEAGAQGLRIGCFRPPSTPDGSSRLRLTAHADLTEDQLDRACDVLGGLR